MAMFVPTYNGPAIPIYEHKIRALKDLMNPIVNQ